MQVIRIFLDDAPSSPSQCRMPTNEQTSSFTSESKAAPCCRAALAFLLMAACGFFIFNCWQLRNLQIDDSYITYRFASRLIHGSLRWNLLEPPVEGYTSFLAVLISTCFEALRLDPLIAWKIFSALLVLCSVAATVWGARMLCAARSPGANQWGVPFLVAALVTANPLAAVHAMSGMETSLFATLLMALTAIALRILFVPGGKGQWLPVLAGGFLLLGLTRPEGVLWAAIMGASVWIGLPGELRRRFARSFLMWFILPGLVYFLARWIYFGDMLPSTFFAKSGGAARPGAGRLLTYLPSYHEIYKYLRDNWLGFAAVATVGGALHFSLNRIGWAKRASGEWPMDIAVAGIFFASLLCIAYFSSVHMLMGYGRRFLFPYSQTFLLSLVLPAILLTGKFLNDGEKMGRPRESREG